MLAYQDIMQRLLLAAALGATAIVVIILAIMKPIERMIFRRNRTRQISIGVEQKMLLAALDRLKTLPGVRDIEYRR